LEQNAAERHGRAPKCNGRSAPSGLTTQQSGFTHMADRATDPPEQKAPTNVPDVVKRVIKQGWLTKQGGASGSFFSRETWKARAAPA